MKAVEAPAVSGFDISALADDSELTVAVPFNEQVTVSLRYIGRDQFADLIKKATTTKWDRKHQPQQEFDDIKFAELLGAEAVVGWNGLVRNDQAFPCTPENVSLLMRKWIDFAKFVSSTCIDLEQMVAAQQEAVRKN